MMLDTSAGLKKVKYYDWCLILCFLIIPLFMFLVGTTYQAYKRENIWWLLSFFLFGWMHVLYYFVVLRPELKKGNIGEPGIFSDEIWKVKQ